jgi:hypothetical protein
MRCARGSLQIDVFHQVDRALEVGEERRHRFAFTLEIFRGGCIGYPNRGIVRFPYSNWRLPKRGSAFTAEVGAWLIRSSALRTSARKRRSAFPVKLASFAIVSSTFGAAHRQPPQFPKPIRKYRPKTHQKENR